MKQHWTQLISWRALAVGGLLALSQGAAADAVGAIQGDFEVGGQGAATWRVAIQVPPAARGFEPQLALAYNSQAGNGIAGLGWMLEGLSVVSRCARDLAQDGDYDGPLQVVMDDRDRFCLDGQRLAVVSGDYGGDAGEYRTRIESFSRVRSYGRIGTGGNGRSLGPRKFKVWRRDGVVMDYGRSEASRLHAPEDNGARAVRVWLLDRISDRFGNEILIRYHKDGERGHRVARVDYGNGKSRVVFQYGQRDDAGRRFTAGAETAHRHRLTSISTWTAWKMVRRYDLAYAPRPAGAAALPSLYPSRLASITECIRNECLPPTRFDWHGQAADAAADWTVKTSASAVLSLFRHSDDFRLGFGDFNGDGLNDIYEVRGNSGRVTDRLYLNLGNGRFDAVDGAATELSGSAGAGQFHFADFDGDGLTDVYQLRYRHDMDVIYLSRVNGGRVSFERVSGIATGAGSRPDIGRCLDIACLKFGDFNGDGRSDIYRMGKRDMGMRGDGIFLSTGAGTFRKVAGIGAVVRRGENNARVDVQRLHIADFNGDGRSDIYYLQEGMDDLHLTVRPGVYRRVNGVGSADRFGSNDTFVHRYRFADFNGDGLADVYYNGLRSGGKALETDVVHLSKGDGTYHTRSARHRGIFSPSYGADKLAGVQVADFNGDGKSDLFEKNGANGSICIIDERQSCAQITVRFTGLSPTHLQFVDFNGDGASDIYWSDRHGGHTDTRGWTPGHAIVRVTDGFGVRTDIAYGHPADPGVHRADGQSAWPNVFAYPPVRVVRRVLTEDEHGELNNRTLYRYGNAKIHLGGHGFLGFGRRDEVDTARGIITRTRFLQDFPYTGQVASVVSKLHDGGAWDDNGDVLSSLQNGYDRVELNHGASIFVRRTSGEEARHDLGLEEISQTESDFEYDEFGNVTLMREEVSGDGRVFTTTTRKRYDNDEDKWLPGQLRHVAVMNEADGQADVSLEEREFDRDPETGAVTREVLGSGARKREYLYRYDNFGNRIAKVERGRSYLPGGVLHQWQTVERETLTTYNDDGRFPVKTVNPMGHTVSSWFGARFGQLLSVTDANGLATVKHYNLWGRQTGESRPDGVETRRRHLWNCSHRARNCTNGQQWGGAPAGAVYAVTGETDGETPRITWHDRFRRKIREAGIGDGGRPVLRDFVHDRFGRVIAESLPYFSGDEAHWTRRQYDVLDRVVSTETPLEDGVAVSSVEYRGLAVDYTNARGMDKTIVKDALGRTVRIAEPEGAVVENTYDAAGRLIAVRDAHGNETTMEYNRRGEKTRLEDPDAGWKSYAYDAFGNVVWDDAPGNETTLVYDKLGRRVEHHYLVAGRHNAWTYDSADNGVGKLAKKKSLDGHIEQYRYDNLGRLAEVNDLRGYVIRTDYDRHGRPARVTRPGGFVVEHAYDAQGRLLALKSPRAQIPDFNAAALTRAQREALQTQTRAAERVAFYRGKVREYEGRIALYRQTAESYLEAPEDLPWSGDKAEELAQRLGSIADGLARKIAKLREEIAKLQKSVTTLYNLAFENSEDEIMQVPVNSCHWEPILIPGGWQPGGWGSSTIGGWSTGGFSQGREVCWTTFELVLVPNQLGLYYMNRADTLSQQANAKRDEVSEKAEELETLVRDEIGDDWKTVARWVLVAEDLRAMHSDLDELDKARANIVAQQQRGEHYGKLGGHYRAINDAAGAQVHHWRAVSRDAAGRVLSEVYGNGLHGENRYHPATGRLLESVTTTPSGRDVRRHAYTYDALGNLANRTDRVRGIEESFAYDELDRLVSSMVTGAGLGDDYNQIALYAYDETGNLISKSGVGDYTYGDQGRTPHAVSSTPRGRYRYDSSGRMVDSPDFTAAWNAYNKPSSITRKSDGRVLRMYYDADRRKIRQTDSAGGQTIHVGNLYEKFIRDGVVQHRHYIHAENRLVAIKSIEGDGGPQTGDFRYFHWDVLGSPDAVSDHSGRIVETFSYTPFGERRAHPGTGGGDAPSAWTRRGYTGHEHLDAFGLIDMKGRVYDPAIGRFLSPDPHVQAPDRTQSHNRYSYVMNNPMKYTDPSGFFFKKAFKSLFRGIRKLFKKRIFRFAVAAVVSYVAGSWAYAKYLGKWGATAAAATAKAPAWALTNARLLQGAVGGATFSASSSALNGDFNGLLGNGLRGALGGSLSGGVNAWFSPGNYSAARVFADSLAGGASEVLHGGKFADGFKASFRAAALSAAAMGMRERMIAQSKLDPRNAAGKSAGFFGDGFKLAGGRIVSWLAEQVPSPFGGVQGGPGAFFGHAYEPGSWLDLVHEAYAGPHDFLNSGYWYDSMGNIKRMSAFARGFGEVLNFANLAVATPFVAASVTPAWATRSLR